LGRYLAREKTLDNRGGLEGKGDEGAENKSAKSMDAHKS